MGVKITVPNTSSDSLTFGSGNTPTAAQVIGIDSGSSNGQLAFNTTASGTSTERMRIDASGNVGVGLTSPASRVDVSSASTGVVKFTTSGGKSGWLYSDSAGIAISDTADLTKNGLYINNTSNYVAVYTGSTGAERARIDSSGNLLVGTTSTIASGKFNVLANSSTNGIACQQVNDANAVYGGVNSSGSVTFYVTGTGQIYSTATSIAAISDQSQKENVVDIPYGLSEISLLRPVKFDFKEGCASEEKELLGFIAQEVENVIPELVKPFGEDGLLGLKMGDMLPVLVKAIQELKAIVDTQAAKIAALEAK